MDLTIGQRYQIECPILDTISEEEKNKISDYFMMNMNPNKLKILIKKYDLPKSITLKAFSYTNISINYSISFEDRNEEYNQRIQKKKEDREKILNKYEISQHIDDIITIYYNNFSNYSLLDFIRIMLELKIKPLTLTINTNYD